MEKLYGEEESELYFNSRFGNDVSIIGDNFLIGSYSDQFSNIELVDTGTHKRLEIEDFNYGPLKFDDDTFNTVDALITNYEYDLNSEYGDAVLKIKIGTLNIDFNKLSEIYVRADFIDTCLLYTSPSPRD